MSVRVPREEVEAAVPWGFVGNVVTGGEFSHLSLRLWVFPFPSRPLHFQNDLKPPRQITPLFFLVLQFSHIISKRILWPRKKRIYSEVLGNVSATGC